MKKIIVFLLLILIFLKPVIAKSYSLENAYVDVIVNKDGSLLITEKILFNFNGCFSYVYRDIPLLPGELITNFQMNSTKSSVFSYTNLSKQISGRLDFTNKICDTTEEVIITYNFLYVTKVYNDISELYLKLWGFGWEKLDNLNAKVSFPDEGIIIYWIHPFYEINYTSNKLNNNILINAENLPKNQWFEIRAIFPKDFLENPIYSKKFNENSKQRIINEEKLSEAITSFAFNLKNISFILPILPLLFFIFMYLKHGREPKIEYRGIYERELPTKHKPAIVNAILDYKLSGYPDIHGFIATIFDLVRRKFLELTEVKTEKKLFFKYLKKDILIKIKNEKQNLEGFEKEVINFLKKYSTENEILWSEFQLELRFKPSEFRDFFLKWQAKVRNKLNMGDYYIQLGYSTIVTFNFLYMVLLIILTFSLTAYLVNMGLLPLFVFLSFVTSFVLSVIPPIIPARRTKKGALFYYKWMAFKRFITHFSLIKEHPPESVKLWDEYLVYAVALGIADNVIKSMKLILPEEKTKSSSFAVIYSHPSFVDGFSSSFAYSSGGSGGGGGGGGGGSGGGGGGAG